MNIVLTSSIVVDYELVDAFLCIKTVSKDSISLGLEEVSAD